MTLLERMRLLLATNKATPTTTVDGAEKDPSRFYDWDPTSIEVVHAHTS